MLMDFHAQRRTSEASNTTPRLTITSLHLLVVVLVVADRAEFVEGQNDELTWWNIGKFLREFANTGLGANKLQKYLNSAYKWNTHEVNGHERLQEISHRVAKMFEWNIKAVEVLQQVVQEQYENWLALPLDKINTSVLCCNAQQGPSDGCSLLPHRGQPDKLYLAPQTPAVVLREMQRIRNLHDDHITHYFAFSDGSLYMYPSRPKHDILACENYDPRLRYFYTQAKSPEPRDVVVVVDAPPVDNPLLHRLVERTLKALSPQDRVGLCLPDGDGCLKKIGDSSSLDEWPGEDQPLGRSHLLGRIIVGSDPNKQRLSHLLSTWLKSSPSTPFPNHTVALTAGTQVLLNSFKQPFTLTTEEPHFVMVYLTMRGEWQRWQDDAGLVSALNESLRHSISVVINPLYDAGEGLEDRELMRLDNSTVKLVAFPTLDKFLSSQTSVSSFGVMVTNKPVIPMPYWDAFGHGYILSVCLPLSWQGAFIGVTCTDYSIINLLADITLDDIENAYVFMVTRMGNTVLHPLLPSPHDLTEHPTYVTIDKLEQDPQVQPILKTIVRQQPGSQDVLRGTLVESVGRPRGRSFQPNAVRRQRADLRYLWAPINLTDFTIALVLPLQNGMVMSSKYQCFNASDCQMNDFQYHVPMPGDNRKFCRFFGTRATKDHGLVKLAPDCFIDVRSYLRSEDKQHIALLYSIFRGHRPYDELLNKDLRASVKLVEQAERVWKQAANVSNYIGQQYMGTSDGVIIAYPGTILKQAYDHRKRPWYLLAVSALEDESISMTTPHCDEFGVGMMYTIAKPLHGPLGNPVAVVAGDFTLQYIMANFLKQVPYCRLHTCLLVDRTGYVVLKTDWVHHKTSPQLCTNTSTIITAHITLLAPDIARDMISNKLLRRLGCHDYEREVTFYYWSLGLSGYRTLHKGSSYRVHKIASSNLFLVVRTKRLMHDGCHCDPYQEKGLMECHDTCELECECPCVAGPNTRPCHNPDSDLHRWSLPACKPRGLALVSANNYTDQQLLDLPACNDFECDFHNERDCNEVVFCLWGQNRCKNVDTQ